MTIKKNTPDWNLNLDTNFLLFVLIFSAKLNFPQFFYAERRAGFIGGEVNLWELLLFPVYYYYPYLRSCPSWQSVVGAFQTLQILLELFFDKLRARILGRFSSFSLHIAISSFLVVLSAVCRSTFNIMEMRPSNITKNIIFSRAEME